MTVHVYPVNDIVEHDLVSDDDCVCGPTQKSVRRPDGSFSWIAVHHSLDGRERFEKDNSDE